MITYVVNVVAIVSKQKLKFIFWDGSRRSECSGEMKLIFFTHHHGVVNVVALGI